MFNSSHDSSHWLENFMKNLGTVAAEICSCSMTLTCCPLLGSFPAVTPYGIRASGQFSSACPKVHFCQRCVAEFPLPGLPPFSRGYALNWISYQQCWGAISTTCSYQEMKIFRSWPALGNGHNENRVTTSHTVSGFSLCWLQRLKVTLQALIKAPEILSDIKVF